MDLPDPLLPVVEDPRRSVVLSDFDGSLAPIVDDPASAHPLPAAVDALARLLPAVGVVGVVSGRPVTYLREHLDLDGLVLAGLYGMERFSWPGGSGGLDVDPLAAGYVGVADRAADEAEELLPGLLVERKSSLACVIHWRTSPAREAEAVDVGARVARAHGLAAAPGRMCLELRPPVAVDKGTVAAVLADGAAVAVFAGDDRGDLAAFEALDRRCRDGSLRAAVKVAVTSSEAPEELLASADLTVEGPDGLVAVLGALGDALASAGG